MTLQRSLSGQDFGDFAVGFVHLRRLGAEDNKEIFKYLIVPYKPYGFEMGRVNIGTVIGVERSRVRLPGSFQWHA